MVKREPWMRGVWGRGRCQSSQICCVVLGRLLYLSALLHLQSSDDSSVPCETVRPLGVVV